MDEVAQEVNEWEQRAKAKAKAMATEEIVVDRYLDPPSHCHWDRGQGRSRHRSELVEAIYNLMRRVAKKCGREVGVVMGLLDSRNRGVRFAQESS